jgi:hypothetical protein
VGGSPEFPVSSSARPELKKKFGLAVAVVEGDGGGIGAARRRSRRVRPTRDPQSPGPFQPRGAVSFVTAGPPRLVNRCGTNVIPGPIACWAKNQRRAPHARS